VSSLSVAEAARNDQHQRESEDDNVFHGVFKIS
jgi:hypothetical protein